MIRDQETRDQARRRLRDNVVVEAGAGTGKTTLLTDRLLFLILAGGEKKEGIPVHRLVALTFTEKAAGEIKIRLATRLSDLMSVLDGRSLPEERRRPAADFLEEVEKHFGPEPAQIRRQAETALQEMDRAQIGTIHHFASSLLKLHPLEAGVDPAFEVDTGERFEELFESEWALWLDEELGLRPPRASQWLEVLPLVPLDDLAQLARALCREGVEESRRGPTADMKRELRDLASQFSALPEGKPPPGGRSGILEAIGAVSGHLQELAASLDDPGAVPAALRRRDFKKEKGRKWPKAWEGHDGENRYREGVRLAGATSAAYEALIRRAAGLVNPFAEMFRARFTAKGLISFDGLLGKARSLVRGHPEVRRALKSRFDAFLIDEFQDTDPVQGELILLLAEDPQTSARDWNENQFRLGAGRLFVVGDPKQSIYRFRGADIRAYERFTGLILRQGGLKCDLQTNFRSHEGLVAPVNAIFSVLMREEKGYQPPYLPIYPRPLPAGVKEEGKEKKPVLQTAVECVFAKGADSGESDLKAQEAQRLEARWIARWVREHCGRAEDTPAPRPERFHLRDVAILLRSTSPLGIYLEAMKESDIPYVVESDRYFYGTQEVIDFINLLRALDDPRDAISLVGLLRSPLVALEDGEIYRLRLAGGLNYDGDPPAGAKLPASSRSRLKAFYALLRRLHSRVGKEPLGDFISRVLNDSFLPELGAAAYHGEQTVSNLVKFGRLAVEAGDHRGTTLKEFIRYVLRSIDESAEEGESPLADEHLDAVRILTIHKSKGLEYPVVFIPNIDASGGRSREGKPAVKFDWAQNTLGLRLPQTKAADVAMALIERAEERREVLEWVRLLYVGMTRAKEKLFLMGRAGKGGRSSFSGMLSRAGAWSDGDQTPRELVLPGGLRLPVVPLEEAPAPPSAKIARKKTGPGRVLDTGPLAGLWKERFETLKKFQGRNVFGTPTEYLREHEKGISSPDAEQGFASPAALVGQVCHRVLQGWNFRGAENPAERVGRAVRILKARHPLAEWGEVSKTSEELLAFFLKTPAARRLGKCEILGREIPFICPYQDMVLRGSVDLLYREAGRLWVADYKTDRISRVDAALKAERYRPQGDAYRHAVKKSLGEPCGFRVIFLRTGEIIDVGGDSK